jgi:hypothetical protein
MYRGPAFHHPHPVPPYDVRGRRGIAGLIGGAIGLTTATLNGATRVVRAVVEGAVWHGIEMACPDCCHLFRQGGCPACSSQCCFAVACTPSHHVCHR